MKRGDQVSVCYDGKWGRRVEGTVLATDRGGRILVRFVPWASDLENPVDHWFHVRRRSTRYGGPRKYFAGFVPVQDSLMRNLYGTHGDWYEVKPLKYNVDNTKVGRWFRKQLQKMANEKKTSA